MKKHFREFDMALAVMRRKWTGAAAILLGLAGISSVQAGTVTSTTSFEYDPTTGLLLTQTREPDNPQLQLKTKYTYDKFGNRLTTEVSSTATGLVAIPTRVVNKTTYDQYGFSPQTITNALGQVVNGQVDPSNQPLFIQELNGLTSTWTYDIFGRQTLEVRPDGTQTKWDYFNCPVSNVSNVGCSSNTKYAVRAQPLDANGVANGPAVVTYYDSLGRVVETQSQAFDGRFNYQMTEYDALGRVYRTSRPWGQQLPRWTVYSYDTLDRVVTATSPDGSVVRTTYNGLTTTVTNELNQTQTKVVNGQGQLVQVTDALGQSLTYAYDAGGNLIKTTDPQGNVVTMVYDALGRKTSMADPDLGTLSYVYDALGELKQQTNAKGQVTTYNYDLLGRLTNRAEPDLVSTWTYDSCYGGKGRLCQVAADNGYQRTQTYDKLGRPAVSTSTVDAAYATTTTYDANSRPATQTYPSGLAVKYVYTALGYLSEVRNNATNALYWQANTRDDDGHLTQQTYGNNVVTQQVFDLMTGRLTNVYAGTGNSVQNLSFVYDARGNMMTRNDANQNLAEAFLYDSLNRLTSNTVTSSGAGLVMQTYSYDAIGNIVNRSDLGTYTYGSGAGPHAVTQIAHPDGSTRQYSYDANGNLMQEVQRDSSGNVQASLGRTEAYSSFNMPITLANPGTTLTFLYGPDHQRVKQIAPGQTTIYVHPDNAGALAFEKDVKANGAFEQRNFITAGGDVVALVKQTGTGTTVTATSTLYMHRDQLGSTTAVTNETGAVLERFAYEPFGKRRTPAGALDPNNTIVGVSTNRGFTNHEELDALDLIHMNGRVYDPAVARFISADPSVPYTGDIQSYNRYSYTRNNPLTAIDPSGFTDVYSADPYESAYVQSFSSPSLFSPWIPTQLPPFSSPGRVAAPVCTLVPMGPVGPVAFSCAPVPVPVPVLTLSQQVDNALPKVLAIGVIKEWELTIKTLDMLSRAKACGWSLDCFKGIIANSDGKGNKDPSTPTGQRGSPMDVPRGTNEPANIGGRDYTGHALDQNQSRGTTPTVVEDTITNGTSQPDKGYPDTRTEHNSLDGRIRVITDKGSGRVITVITK